MIQNFDRYGVPVTERYEGTGDPPTYRRNPSWLTVETPTDERVRMLFPVGNGTNKIAFLSTGATTINWGDGSSAENVATNTKAERTFAWADVSADTQAPCTVADSLVTRTAHGHVDGDLITLYGTPNVTGYVIDATADTFRVSSVRGGSPMTEIVNGTYYLLPYRQVVIEVTPQAGQVLSTMSLRQLPTGESGNWDNKILEFRGHIPNATAWPLLGNTAATSVRCQSLVAVEITGCAATNASNLVSFCGSLRSFATDTSAVTNFNSTWYGCSSLVSLDVDTSSGTGFFQSWRACSSLVSLSVDTSGGTNFASAWFDCSSLTSLSVDTSQGTIFASAWRACSSLVSLDVDTSQGTDFGNAWVSCSSLTSLSVEAISYTHSLASCKLQRPTILAHFAALADLTGSASETVTITGNPGVASLTGVDLAIATDKNWTVVT